MSRTIAIGGSDEVMAMLGSPGTYYRGKWQDVRITGVGSDEDTPLNVRESLVGLTVPTIFTKEQIRKQTGKSFDIVPDGARLAYMPDVISVLAKADKHEAAEQLRTISDSPLDMYVIETDIHEPI